MTYTAHRDHRFEYAADAVHHIEANNCGVGPGCVHGSTDPDEPGGTCALLAAVFLEDPVPELDDDGTTITCRKYSARAYTGIVENPDQPALFPFDPKGQP